MLVFKFFIEEVVVDIISVFDKLEVLSALSLGIIEEKVVVEIVVFRIIGVELMEFVRRNIGLSYELCRVVIGVVVGYI